MKKVVMGIGVAAFVAAVLFLLQKKQEAILLKDGPIVVAGDSLVAGIGATTDNDIVSVLSRRLGQSVVNAGVSGDITEGLLGRIDRDVLAHNPSIVVVIIGGNDFLRRVPKETTLSTVRLIIEKIKASGAAVLLVGIDSLVYNTSYRSIADEYRIRFIPNLLGSVRRDPSFMSDTIHPNDKGYLLFADAIEKEIQNMRK